MGRVIGGTWVTDLTHFIDETGGLHHLLTVPGRNLALHMTAIVAAATSQLGGGSAHEVRCRRRPNRRPCSGTIQHRLWADERITWECPICGDNGVISNWQSTPWDMRLARPVH
jgi:hypothetical protein